MPRPFLVDLSHTAHTRARTGVQRVTRALAAGLGGNARLITHDPYRRAWRALQGWERANLAAAAPAAGRGARWPLTARIGGSVRRWCGGSAPAPATGEAGLIVPEIFSAAVARALPALRAQVRGPRVALFHDAIALQLPELTPAKTVARFPAYLRELLQFDGVAAVSADSRQALVEYWDWLGVASPPPVVAIPLGLDLPAAPPAPAPAAGRPTVLCVASLEGRKNQVALLEACEQLWADGRDFELRLIGLAQAETGRAALAMVDALRQAGRPLRYDGPVDDATLAEAYRQCAFTVYPSLREGFGLPVLESLAQGRPCICLGQGALAEAAQGGGCHLVETADAAALTTAIGALLGQPALRDRLGAEAGARRFKPWSDYVRELTGWAETLARRP
jgi:glycosyltransferase involved in cell wall biosynthesis